MNRDTMKQMGRIHFPLQPLIVTFGPGTDGVRMLSVLNGYAERDLVKFDYPSEVRFILGTQVWGRTGRKLTMWFVHGRLWFEEGFLKLAERGIEAIRVASESPLNALQSSKQKKREEALASITGGVLTDELRKEFSDLNLTFECSVLEMHGLHSMRIMVRNCEKTAFNIHLDGWSGNIISGTGEILCFCSSFTTVQTKLREMLNTYLEEATA